MVFKKRKTTMPNNSGDREKYSAVKKKKLFGLIAVFLVAITLTGVIVFSQLVNNAKDDSADDFAPAPEQLEALQKQLKDNPDSIPDGTFVTPVGQSEIDKKIKKERSEGFTGMGEKVEGQEN